MDALVRWGYGHARLCEVILRYGYIMSAYDKYLVLYLRAGIAASGLIALASFEW